MACMPWLSPRLWEKRVVQAVVMAACALPIVAFSYQHGEAAALGHRVREYATFIATLGALYVVAGGVLLSADLRATPGVNVAFLLVGSVLASAIGTTGASVLLIRPLLRTNSQREHTRHLVPFFILSVANAGGLLTPLGDAPLLVGFVGGVPFFWTLRLWPFWLLYTSLFAALFFWVDRRAYARETAAALLRDEREPQPFTLEGKQNLALLLAVIIATFLPSPWRELVLVGIALGSYATTPRELRQRNGFSFGPMLEVALLFLGLFVCLGPVEAALSHAAPELPLQRSYQLFWGSGLLSAVLDNAPTYAAFAALARGLSRGQTELVAGVAPLQLMAISVGSVVMGATTYIGNAPNLMLKSIAERSGVRMPSFFRFAAFALLVTLPAHLLVSAAFWLLER